MNLYNKFKKLPKFIVETLTHDQLNEIVNMQRTYTKTNDFIDQSSANKDRQKILSTGGSSGMFGGGMVDSEDPHMFNKQSFDPLKSLKKDPYYQYIKLASRYMKSNPMFPRVYLVNITKDRFGVQQPNYKIETLSHIHDIKDCEQLIQIGYSVSKKLGDFLSKKYEEYEQPQKIKVDGKQYTDVGYDNKLQTDDQGRKIDRYEDDDMGGLQYDLIDRISRILKMTISGFSARGERYVENTLTPQMQQVIKVIRYLQTKYNYTLDIHDGNFMIRRTPYGPQLVITDPLA